MSGGLVVLIVYALGWGIAVPITWRLLDEAVREGDTEIEDFGEFTAHGVCTLIVALFWPIGLAVGGPAWIAHRIYLRRRRRF